MLVAVHDQRAQPKIIDFGIAKAVEQRLSDGTLVTGLQLIGTPAYMSPEQAELSSRDIDTRSDVYALGVLLYELLTGVLPIEARSSCGPRASTRSAASFERTIHRRRALG